MYAMSRRTTGGTLAAWMIIAAIVGFAGGAFAGTQSDNNNPSTPTGSSTNEPTSTPKATQKPKTGIELSAAKDTVKANEQLDLSGKMTPAKEGVVFDLERRVDDGSWEKFDLNTPVTTNSDGSFSTYIFSGRKGTNEFRLVQVDDPSKKSNVVTVTIS